MDCLFIGDPLEDDVTSVHWHLAPRALAAHRPPTAEMRNIGHHSK
jgi:hypothetical protein